MFEPDHFGMSSSLRPGFAYATTLGHGGQAIVELWREIQTNTLYAAKIFIEPRREISERIQVEAMLLTKLSSPAIVRGIRLLLPHRGTEVDCVSDGAYARRFFGVSN
jgi:hypothetical protein